jgi:hypothetical protein
MPLRPFEGSIRRGPTFDLPGRNGRGPCHGSARPTAKSGKPKQGRRWADGARTIRPSRRRGGTCTRARGVGSTGCRGPWVRPDHRPIIGRWCCRQPGPKELLRPSRTPTPSQSAVTESDPSCGRFQRSQGRPSCTDGQDHWRTVLARRGALRHRKAATECGGVTKGVVSLRERS